MPSKSFGFSMAEYRELREQVHFNFGWPWERFLINRRRKKKGLPPLRPQA